jgi:hypothetical protein
MRQASSPKVHKRVVLRMSSDNSNYNPLDIYKDICNNIRVTDDISFKLLGIVPLASGAGSGALTILEKCKLLEGYTHPELVVVGLSALGALITFGLFRWEIRNIQKCLWLIARAVNFETEILHQENLQFSGMAKEEHLDAKTMDDIRVPSLLKTPWGKTQSEKLVYLASIGAWLVPLWLAMYKFSVSSR